MTEAILCVAFVAQAALWFIVGAIVTTWRLGKRGMIRRV